jgi:hypothetical protein
MRINYKCFVMKPDKQSEAREGAPNKPQKLVCSSGSKKRSRTFLPDFKLQPDALKEKVLSARLLWRIQKRVLRS